MAVSLKGPTRPRMGELRGSLAHPEQTSLQAGSKLPTWMAPYGPCAPGPGQPSMATVMPLRIRTFSGQSISSMDNTSPSQSTLCWIPPDDPGEAGPANQLFWLTVADAIVCARYPSVCPLASCQLCRGGTLSSACSSSPVRVLHRPFWLSLHVAFTQESDFPCMLAINGRLILATRGASRVLACVRRTCTMCTQHRHGCVHDVHGAHTCWPQQFSTVIQLL